MKKNEVTCIIDDDMIYVYSMKRLFALHDVNDVLTFQNGEEAIRHFEAADAARIPDVVLLDINMPVMNGWEFLEQFKKIKPMIQKEVTIYVISSSVDDDDMKRAQTYDEVSGYFVKPVSLDNLQQILSA